MVVTVRFAVAVPPATSVTGDVMVQAAPVGAAPCTAQIRATLLAKPFTEVNFSVPVPVAPAVTVIAVDVPLRVLSLSVKLGAVMPVPVSAIVCV